MSAQRVNSRSWRWRGTYFVTLGAAVAALVAGIAYATGGAGFGSATTGSVELGLNAPPPTTTCSYPNLVPGDLPGVAPCTMSVNYVGSIPAYVSLTVAVQSTAGVGGQLLYNGTHDPHYTGLSFTITDNGGRSFTVPSGATTACPPLLVGYTCWTAANDLADWYTGSTPNPDLTFTSASPAVTWTVVPSFPRSASKNLQGTKANLILTARAVQAPANPISVAGCTTSTIGQNCLASGGFTWN